MLKLMLHTGVQKGKHNNIYSKRNKMNRFDTLEELLQEVDADEILHQIIQNMSNAEGISLLNQVAMDLGIEKIEDPYEDLDDYDYDYEDD